MIKFIHVTKRFGKRNAVCDFSLHVPQGKIYGLLGHNGAGKSTALGMMLGQVRPNKGRIHVCGHDVFKSRSKALQHVGAIYETPAFYSYLSGWRNLKIFCEYSGRFDRKRAEQVIDLVGLTERIGDKVAVYSHGMRQRLAIAQTLLPTPKLLILDEPSDGLDPQGMHDMRHLMKRLNKEWGLTILFSSHILSEVEQLCDRLTVLHEGQLIFEGQWREAGLSHRLVQLEMDRQQQGLQALTEANLICNVQPNGIIELSDTHDSAFINRWLIEHDFEVRSISPIQPTLEDFYLKTVRQSQEGQS